MSTLPGLITNLILNSSAFEAGLRNASNSMDRAARQMSSQNANLQRSFAVATTAANALKNAIIGMIGVFSAEAVLRLGKGALDAAGNLQEMAQSAGVTTKQLQVLQLAGVQVGLSQEQMTTGLSQFTKRIGEAAQGSGSLLKILQSYNIAIKDAEGRTRSSFAILGDLAEAFQRTGSASERARIGSAAFGRAFQQFIPLLAEGREGLLEVALAAERAGLIIDAQLIEQADRASDSLAALQFAAQSGFQIGVIKAFGDSIGNVQDNLGRAVRAGELFGTAVGKAMQAVARSITFVATHIEEIKFTLTALVALRAGAYFIAFAEGLREAAVAMGLLNAATLAGPWGLVIRAVTAVVTVLSVYHDKVVQIGDLHFKLGDVLTSIWVTVKTAIAGVLTGVGQLALALVRLTNLDFSGAVEAWNASARGLADAVTAPIAGFKAFQAAAGETRGSAEYAAGAGRIFADSMKLMESSLGPTTEGLGGAADAADDLDTKLADLQDRTKLETAQLKLLQEAYKGAGGSMADVADSVGVATRAIEIQNELISQGISLEDALASGAVKEINTKKNLEASVQGLAEARREEAQAARDAAESSHDLLKNAVAEAEELNRMAEVLGLAKIAIPDFAPLAAAAPTTRTSGAFETSEVEEQLRKLSDNTETYVEKTKDNFKSIEPAIVPPTLKAVTAANDTVKKLEPASVPEPDVTSLDTLQEKAASAVKAVNLSFAHILAPHLPTIDFKELEDSMVAPVASAVETVNAWFKRVVAPTIPRINFSGIRETLVDPIMDAVQAANEWFASLKDPEPPKVDLSFLEQAMVAPVVSAVGTVNQLFSEIQSPTLPRIDFDQLSDFIVAPVRDAVSAVNDWFARLTAPELPEIDFGGVNQSMVEPVAEAVRNVNEVFRGIDAPHVPEGDAESVLSRTLLEPAGRAIDGVNRLLQSIIAPVVPEGEVGRLSDTLIAPVADAVTAVNEWLSRLEAPTLPEIDLGWLDRLMVQPVMAAVDSVNLAFSELRAPELPTIDFTAVTDAMVRPVTNAVVAVNEAFKDIEFPSLPDIGFTRLFDLMVQPASAAVSAVNQAFDLLKAPKLPPINFAELQREMVQPVVAAVDAVADAFGQLGSLALPDFAGAITAQAQAAVQACLDMVAGIREALGPQLQTAFSGAENTVAEIIGLFREMYEQVVGHSWVPDMIKGIGSWFGRLFGIMVEPTAAAVQRVTSQFSELGKAFEDISIPEIPTADTSSLVGSLIDPTKRAVATVDELLGGIDTPTIPDANTDRLNTTMLRPVTQIVSATNLAFTNIDEPEVPDVSFGILHERLTVPAETMATDVNAAFASLREPELPSLHFAALDASMVKPAQRAADEVNAAFSLIDTLPDVPAFDDAALRSEMVFPVEETVGETNLLLSSFIKPIIPDADPEPRLFATLVDPTERIIGQTNLILTTIAQPQMPPAETGNLPVTLVEPARSAVEQANLATDSLKPPNIPPSETNLQETFVDPIKKAVADANAAWDDLKVPGQQQTSNFNLPAPGPTGLSSTESLQGLEAAAQAQRDRLDIERQLALAIEQRAARGQALSEAEIAQARTLYTALKERARAEEETAAFRADIGRYAQEAEQLQLIIDARGQETEELRVQQDLLEIRQQHEEEAAAAAEETVRAFQRQVTAAQEVAIAADLGDQIEDQRLILRFAGQETEEYRVQVQLLQLKRQTGKDVTAQQEAQVRELQRVTTINRKNQEAQSAALADQERQATAREDMLTQPFENALTNIQGLMTNTFEQIFRGGIDSFEDLGTAIKDIFIRLAAEIATLMIIQPVLAGGVGGLGGVAAGAAGAGAASTAAGTAINMAPLAGAAGMQAGQGMAAPLQVTGWREGLHGGTQAAFAPAAQAQIGFWGRAQAMLPQLILAGGLGFVGGGLIGKQFGGQGELGGGIGGAAGAVAGSLIPGGGILGPLIGGVLGGIGGGFLGSLFGGGESRNIVAPQGGLGKAGLGGTGAASQFVQQFDKQMSELLNDRQRQLVDRALEAAAGTSVSYDKTLSPGDMSRLATGRIGPAAEALGFKREAIVGGPSELRAPEEQMKLFAQALETQAAVEDLTSGLGDFAKEMADLKERFDELTESAKKFGISREGLAKAQRELAFDAIRDQISQVAGEAPTFGNEFKTIIDQFKDIFKAAKDFDFPREEIVDARREAIRDLKGAFRDQLDALAGSTTPFSDQLEILREQFAALRQDAKALGIPLDEVSDASREATRNLRTSFRDQLDELTGSVPSFSEQLERLREQFSILKRDAKGLGIPLEVVSEAFQEAAENLRRAQRAQVAAFHEQLAQLGGVAPTFQQQMQALKLRFAEMADQARDLGISIREVTRAEEDAVENLRKMQRETLNQMALGVTTPFEQLKSPLEAFQKQLQFAGMSPAEQLAAAERDFQRIARLAARGDTEAIQQLTAAGDLFIRLAEQVGASGGAADARQEVAGVIESVLKDIEKAQEKASRGLEAEIRRASREQVDTLKELIEIGEETRDEIKRLRKRAA